ncbi:MAG: DUF2851 family protein [Bacteroidales bacterium]|nr:DUF2851 family protein [Bacteroidales bacterium]
MEQLLHYVWKHKLFPLSPLTTTDGRQVEVIHPGLHNHDAGPDFFNAKVKIGGQLWVGNVEIHSRASDWYRHHHDTDPAYANVVLHVVGDANMEIPQQGEPAQMIPQLVLPIPSDVRENYDRLSRHDGMPRCRAVLGTLPTLTIHSWMSALQVERLEERTTQVMERRSRLGMDWEATLFVTLARTFGFGINGDAMEQWAQSVPLSAVGKHRDDLFQIEAIFLGQAGLLEAAHDVPYFVRLQKEYAYLRHKFTLIPLSADRWRFARLRPQNFPYLRIAQLAMLYYERRLNFSCLLEAKDAESLRNLLQTHVSEFWQTHYTFDSETSSQPSDRRLSDTSIDSVIINAVVPILFAYGRYKSDEQLCERSLQLLESLKPENNNIVRAWARACVVSESAADTQALIHLTRQYCEPHNCLRCRFGYEYLRRTPDFLAENPENQPATNG